MSFYVILELGLKGTHILKFHIQNVFDMYT